MNSKYYSLASEISELESILADIPNEDVIERKTFESRLVSARKVFETLPKTLPVEVARLTFRGRPVLGSHGIAAEFGSKAATAFSEAFSAVVAGLTESLRYMGPIPDKAKNQLLITGTAIGSFGFEFELPTSHDELFPETRKTEEAVEMLQSLLRVSVEGSDDDVTDLVEAIHPRAVRKVADFLGYMVQQQAWCGLEFKGQVFRYNNVEQLEAATARLQEENICERDEEYVGEFQGVLPQSRTFEFKLGDQPGVIRGKIDQIIEEPDLLNREWLHKPVRIGLHVMQVGQGRPRFTLPNLEAIHSI